MQNWDIIAREWERFASGYLTTLTLFALSTLIAFAMALVLANALFSRRTALRGGARVFVDGMRMLPFLIYAYLLYYGLPSLGIRLDAWTAGVIALGTYHAAYIAEILRGAWAQLPAGQTESAKAMGHHGFGLFRRIVLPQLVLSSGPVLGNQLIYMLKDTAFLMIITVQELTYAASSVQSMYFVPLEPFLVAILLYWSSTLLIERLIKFIQTIAEKRGLGRS